MQFELAVGEGTPQIKLHVAALLRLPVHFLFEETVDAAAVRLARYSAMSALRIRFLAVLAVARRQRDSDAGADR